MENKFSKSKSFSELLLWEKLKHNCSPTYFSLEITARCNNNCRHCYINLPAADAQAKSKELSFGQIKDIIDQAFSLGALWCLITGGEPLLREDFFDIYLYLKKKGLLVCMFTNASLITQKHIDLFKKYPPRNIEVTVYGANRQTYERVTQVAGSYATFIKGLDLLCKNKINLMLKGIAMRSNLDQLTQIARFCRSRTRQQYRFDPFLHKRYDNAAARNRQIDAERLRPEEIAAIEQSDPERTAALKKKCSQLTKPDYSDPNSSRVFNCGVAAGNFSVSYEGFFRLCSSLCHPDYVFDLKQGTLKDAFENLISKVKNMHSSRKEFLAKCRNCPIINLCMWCPAYSYLETGQLDTPVDYFCGLAHARAEALGYKHRVVSKAS